MQYTVCDTSTLLSPAPILSRGSRIAAPNTARSRRSSLAPEFTPASSLLWEKGPSICLFPVSFQGREKCDLPWNEPALHTPWFICCLDIPGGNTKGNLHIHQHTNTHTHIPSSPQQHCSPNWHGLHFRVKHTRLFFCLFFTSPLREPQEGIRNLLWKQRSGG